MGGGDICIQFIGSYSSFEESVYYTLSKISIPPHTDCKHSFGGCAD